MNIITRFKQALAWHKEFWNKRLTLARARFKRRRLANTVFVGITGSVGKTTTKDLAVSVLSRKAPTQGNRLGLNYLDDMAKAVISVRQSDLFAVFEVATSGPGTIDERIDLVSPSIAVMTVIGRDHIKSFGSIEAIAEEKAKLIMALPETGTAVLNRDDPLIRSVGEKTSASQLWFGIAEDADLRLLEARSDYPEPLTLTLAYQGQNYICRTNLYGTHLAVSVLAALGIGLAAGMSMEEAIAGLADASTTSGRMQIVQKPDGVTFLRDDFKAPHWTLQTTLDFLKNAQAKRKVAIIGTLSDYSLSASKLYPKVARRLRDVTDLVIFVGPHALRALKARTGENDDTLRGFTQIQDAHQFLQEELRAGDFVLLKGSNRADHLVRLMLARYQPVTCWITDCGWNRFCDACEFIQREDFDKNQHSYNAVSDNNAESTESDCGAWLVVGLGNPGEDYADTPHNIGGAVLDRLAQQLQKAWSKEPEGHIIRTCLHDQEVILFKPGSFMNDSGTVVEALRQRLKVSRKKVMVVYDDIDLPLSEVRLKTSGSDGGHKGLRSLFSVLSNDGFMPRVRVGVRSSNADGSDARSIVLSRFTSEDQLQVETALERAIALISQSLKFSDSENDKIS